MDNVYIPHEGDRPADLGLGCYVTDAEPVRPVQKHTPYQKREWSGLAVSLMFTNRTGLEGNEGRAQWRETVRSARVDYDGVHACEREGPP